MITNGILIVFQGVINILLAPLELINIGINFVASIPIVASFINLVAYILPWSNILPVIILIFALFGFRIGVALIRLIKSFIPTMGGF